MPSARPRAPPRGSPGRGSSPQVVRLNFPRASPRARRRAGASPRPRRPRARGCRSRRAPGTPPPPGSRSAPARRCRSCGPARCAPSIAMRERAQHGRVALVEGAGQDLRVAVDAEHELGQVVAADREAVEVLGEAGPSAARSRGSRTSRRSAGPRTPRSSPCFAISRCTARASPLRAAERDHHDHVVEPHLARARGAARGTRARSPRGRRRARSARRRGTRASGSPPSARRARRRAGSRTRWS